jgi:glycine hydroxymethyltransferase
MILSKGIVGNPLKAPEKTIENIPTLIDRAVFPGMQGGPHMHSIAAKAVALHEAAQPEFREYAEQVLKNASVLAEELKKGGLKLVGGGTKNHLILANVYESFGIDGKEAQERLEAVGITLNANAVPDDPLPPFRPSGIRLGTPAVTTQGMKEDDMITIAQKILATLRG